MNDLLYTLTLWGLNIVYLFLAAVFLIEIAIYYIKLTARQKAFARLTPLILAVLDPFNVSYYINPLMCESCIQKLMLYFMPSIKSYLAENEMRLSQYFFEAVPNLIAQLTLSALITVTIYSLGKHLIVLGKSLKTLRQVIDRSSPCSRPIQCGELKHKIVTNKYQLLVSDEISTPLAAFNSYILLPTRLSESLSQHELEAVLSHETEHLIWKDPFIKCVLHTISALFWWLPTRDWLNKIDHEVELACDFSVEKYNLETNSLASVMIALLRTPQEKLNPLLTSFTGTKARIQTLIDPASAPKTNIQSYLVVAAIGGILGAICMCF